MKLARFVQLATCIAELYALDERGRVWSYDPKARAWRPIPAARLAAPRAARPQSKRAPWSPEDA